VARGIDAETSGRGEEALRYFRQAVEADGTFAGAHMNLGIALQGTGELNAATRSYELAVASDPEYAAAHYNLARVGLLCSRYSEAETSFRTALQLRPDFPEAWVGLAGALEALDRNHDALAALDEALRLRSDYVGALLNSLVLLRKTGQIEAAAANSRRILELEPENELAHATLGMSLRALGRFSEAESSYRQALLFNPENREVKNQLALVLRATGRAPEAIPLLLDLAADDPGNAELDRNLAETLHGFELHQATARARAVLLRLCMNDDTLVFVTPTIVALIRNDEGFQLIKNYARRADDPLAAIAPPVVAFLREPLFLAALPRMLIIDATVEEVLTHLRRCILARFRSLADSDGSDPDVPAEFVCALARQCFFSAYAFVVDETEVKQLASLREAIENVLLESNVTSRRSERALAVASLYVSLHTLKGSERLLAQPSPEWSEPFRPILREQIENREREREIAAQLTSITTIDDEVSQAVRALYEDNPYPRWTTMQTPPVDTIERLAGRLRPGEDIRVRERPVSILIAGCGTGRHSISVGKAYPDGEILAVDLSRASLAYAARMSEASGVSNITYRQADILKLGTIAKRFDVVQCAGVLHHLEDPMAGWRILIDLLEPDGLMRIALYSETARRGINAARELTRSLGVRGTPDGIRQCRRVLMALPQGHPARDVLTCGDFFSLDGCRDLLMHVQEHQFTLPRLDDCLDELGLRFLGFECPNTTRDRFKSAFPDHGATTDLKAWHRFEEANPATFLGTYDFWCCTR
jgi:tetratricopeptide (TPR) repeat protein/2-polyprenyl-3-methyl-5-hydroxy-6-metoxy-1,4-benzoquinol methylase